MNNFEQTLNVIDRTQIGPEERELIDDGIAQAIEAGDEVAEYRFRMRLIASAFMSGDNETTLSSFAWCLGKHDSDPARFPQKEDDRLDLFWYFKWMPGIMASNPRWSRELIESYLDDLEGRYRRAGVGLSGMWQCRLDRAITMGDLGDALQYQEEREALPSDEYSHCDACVRSTDADLYALAGDEEKALAKFDEIIEGNFQCGDEPERTLGSGLLRLLRAGRLEEAQEHHLRGLRLAKVNPDPFPLIQNHLIYCAVTGNEARGLGLLERYLLGVTGSPLNLASRFHAVSAFAVLLDSVTRAGFGESTVLGSEAPQLAAVFGEHDGAWAVSDFAAACWGVAEKLATDFDSRNGNDHYAVLVAQSRALAAEHWDLPLGDVFVPEHLPKVKEPSTASEWHSVGRQRLMLMGDPEGALAAADEGLAFGPDPILYSLAVHSLLSLDRVEDAEKRLAERVAALRSQGRGPRADMEERLGLRSFGLHTAADKEALLSEVTLAREAGVPAEVLVDSLTNYAEWLLKNDETEAGLAAVNEALALAREAGPGEQLTNTLLMHASVMRGHGETELATQTLDELLASLEEVAARATAMRWRAEAHANAGEFLAALKLADQLQELHASIGNRFGVVDNAAMAAHMLSSMDRDAEAVSRMQVALRQAQLAGATQVAGLLFNLGKYQQWSGQSVAAQETFGDLILSEEAAGVEPEALAMSYYWLAGAARSSGDLQNSYGSFSKVLELLEESSADGLVYQARLGRGKLLFDVGDDDAMDDLIAAVTVAQRMEDANAVADARHWLGRARCNADDEAGLVDLDAAREHKLQVESPYEAADILDSKGCALVGFERFDEGLALITEASHEMSAIGADFPAMAIGLNAARAMVQREEHDRAVVLYNMTLSKLQPGEDHFQTVSFEFGDLLEQLGRTEEAASIRSAAM